MSGNRIRKAALLAAMLLILLLFTLPLWSSSRLPYMGDLINSDITELNFPARYLLSQSLEGGGLPIWNPYIGCGFPQLGEGQSGMLYPFNLLLFSLLKPTPAFNLSLIISLLMALIFSYLLFRHYGLSRPASLFSAVAFAFSGFMMAKLKFTYMINSLCWLPLAIYGVEKTFARRNMAFLFLTTLSLAMQLLAGGPQIFVITLIAVVMVFAWRLVSLLKEGAGTGGRPGWRIAMSLLLGIILCVMLAAALAAPQLLPQLRTYPLTDRAVDLPFSWSLGVPMQPRSLVQFVSPFQYGNPAKNTYDLKYNLFWEDIAYPGLLTLVLALIAVLFLARRDGTLLMWLLIAFLALVISFADYFPVAEFLWKYVPGFKMFRFWQRFLVLVVMCMALLAGKGLDLVLSRMRPGKIWYGLMVALVMAVLLVDLGLFCYNQVSTIDSRRMLEDNRTAQLLQEKLEEKDGDYRIAVLGQKELWQEVVSQSHGWLGDKDLFLEYMETLSPNHNTIFGISGVSQYGDYGLYGLKMLDTLTNYIYLRKDGWKADMSRSALNILAAENARYLVTPFILEEEGLNRVDELETDIRGVNLYIYEISETLPRVHITQNYEVLDEGTPISLNLIVATMYDMERVKERIILEDQPYLQYGPEPAGEARIVSYDKGKVVIEADSPGGGILVLRDSYYPEWHALVDGEEREIMRVDYNFRGVELEPGEHVVEFVLKPSSLYYGAVIFGISLLLLLLLLLQNREKGIFRLDRERAEGSEGPPASGDPAPQED